MLNSYMNMAILRNIREFLIAINGNSKVLRCICRPANPATVPFALNLLAFTCLPYSCPPLIECIYLALLSFLESVLGSLRNAFIALPMKLERIWIMYYVY